MSERISSSDEQSGQSPKSRQYFLSGWAQGASSMLAVAQALTEPSVQSICLPVLSLAEHIPSVVEAGQPSAYARGLAAKLREDQTSFPAPNVLIAWSMGGMVALETAIHFPELVSHLVLVSSCAKFTTAENYPAGVDRQLLRALELELRRVPQETIERFQHMVFSKEFLTPEVLQRKVTEALALGEYALQRGLRYLDSSDLRRDLALLRQPLLLIHGLADIIVPKEASEFLKQRIPAAEFVLLRDGTHGLPEERAVEVAAVIREFLR